MARRHGGVGGRGDNSAAGVGGAGAASEPLSTQKNEMQHSSAMKRWSAWGLLWATGAGAQGTSPTLVYPDELLPTRMVLCQREVGGAERERDRSAKLRTCLARRDACHPQPGRPDDRHRRLCPGVASG